MRKDLVSQFKLYWRKPSSLQSVFQTCQLYRSSERQAEKGGLAE